MKETFYERIGEAVCRQRLANGLEVCVVPKPGYSKKYAFFSTRYGGMDTRFRLDGKWLDTPAGIAHYLEHKMFDTREGNALQELAKNGAEPNAFTANAMTARVRKLVCPHRGTGASGDGTEVMAHFKGTENKDVRCPHGPVSPAEVRLRLSHFL